MTKYVFLTLHAISRIKGSDEAREVLNLLESFSVKQRSVRERFTHLLTTINNEEMQWKERRELTPN